MNQINKEAFKRYSNEALRLINLLLLTKRDEMNSITKEYVDKLFETANMNPKDFDIDYEPIWSYMIGFCYGQLAGKDTGGEE